jgi:hypothetical protein
MTNMLLSTVNIARIQKAEDERRRTTRGLRTRGPKYIVVDGGIFKYLLWTLTNLSFVWNKFVI